MASINDFKDAVAGAGKAYGRGVLLRAEPDREQSIPLLEVRASDILEVLSNVSGWN